MRIDMYLSVEEGFAIFKLLELVIVGVLFDMIAELFSLLNQTIWHLFVNIFE
jgi:hypothetical protein